MRHWLRVCNPSSASARNVRGSGLFSKAGEVRNAVGSLLRLDLQVQMHLGADSTAVSEGVPVYLQTEFAPAEKQSFWQRHFITSGTV